MFFSGQLVLGGDTHGAQETNWEGQLGLSARASRLNAQIDKTAKTLDEICKDADYHHRKSAYNHVRGTCVRKYVKRNKAHRTADFRRGKRLGDDDHIVHWRKPTSIRSLDRQSYNALPDFTTIRETRIQVTQPGFRTKSIVVVTTLLDPQRTTKEELAILYRARWNNELDLRSIKSTMQMDDLRCKTPELVRKEIWTHVLAYNLIRTLMAQAAAMHGLLPRSISFKGAMQTLEAFQPLLELQAARGRTHRMRLYQHLLRAIATHRVADRPDRFEPRVKKHRRNHYGWLTRPRSDVKRDMAKGVITI